MDAATISLIASTTVSLLTPYLKSLGSELTKKAGEQIGTEIGKTASSKAKELYDAVKAKFSSNHQATKIADAFEKSPEDSDVQAVVRFQLKDAMSTDEDFARTLAHILKDASEAGVDSVFQTTVLGDVKNLVQMGNVYGTVSF